MQKVFVHIKCLEEKTHSRKHKKKLLNEKQLDWAEHDLWNGSRLGRKPIGQPSGFIPIRQTESRKVKSVLSK